jgi:cell wall-associated NlpC family hydrolase
MSARRDEDEDIPIFGWLKTKDRPASGASNPYGDRDVPIFIFLLMVMAQVSGCASTPAAYNPAKPPPQAMRQEERSAERDRGEEVADYALSLRGAPYRYGGATRGGFDCSGLVFYTHRQLGLSVPRTSRDQARQADEVKQRKLQRGDLVFFKIGSRRVNHVGIYIGDQRFVHAPGAGKPVSINSLDDEFYAERFESAGRFWNHASR